MNTTPNINETRSGLAKLNPEHAASDTNSIRIYEVKLRITEHRNGYAIVTANGEEHARELAKRQERQRSWASDCEVETDTVTLVAELFKDGGAE